MEIGEKIKFLRLQNNLTQEELGDRCELTKGYISMIEKDKTSPSIATLKYILEALGTNLADFFADEEQEKVVFGGDDYAVKEDAELKNTTCWLIPNAQKNEMEPILRRAMCSKARSRSISERKHTRRRRVRVSLSHPTSPTIYRMKARDRRSCFG